MDMLAKHNSSTGISTMSATWLGTRESLLFVEFTSVLPTHLCYPVFSARPRLSMICLAISPASTKPTDPTKPSNSDNGILRVPNVITRITYGMLWLVETPLSSLETVQLICCCISMYTGCINVPAAPVTTVISSCRHQMISLRRANK